MAYRPRNVGYAEPGDSDVAETLRDITRAGANTRFALIGGQALRAYRVPRTTLDVDVLLEMSSVETVVNTLISEFQWTPLLYDDDVGDYAVADAPHIHEFDDPVLFSLGVCRELVPILSRAQVVVEFLVSAHPIEEDILSTAVSIHRFPTAPLGGVLLLKAMAHRTKDIAAIEQTAEHLDRDTLAAAIRWADQRDHGETEDLKAIIEAVKRRRNPTRLRRL